MNTKWRILTCFNLFCKLPKYNIGNYFYVFFYRINITKLELSWIENWKPNRTESYCFSVACNSHITARQKQLYEHIFEHIIEKHVEQLSNNALHGKRVEFLWFYRWTPPLACKFLVDGVEHSLEKQLNVMFNNAVLHK